MLVPVVGDDEVLLEITARHQVLHLSHPDGERRITGFRAEPYPQWSFRAPARGTP